MYGTLVKTRCIISLMCANSLLLHMNDKVSKQAHFQLTVVEIFLLKQAQQSFGWVYKFVALRHPQNRKDLVSMQWRCSCTAEFMGVVSSVWDTRKDAQEQGRKRNKLFTEQTARFRENQKKTTACFWKSLGFSRQKQDALFFGKRIWRVLEMLNDNPDTLKNHSRLCVLIHLCPMSISSQCLGYYSSLMQVLHEKRKERGCGECKCCRFSWHCRT